MPEPSLAEPSLEEIVDTVEDLDAFSVVPRDALAGLFEAALPLKMAPGEVLFREGDPADTAVFVASGRLVVEVGEGAAVRRVGEVLPGEICGEQALYLRGGRRNATVRVALPTLCLVLDASALLRRSDSPAVAAFERRQLVVLAGRIRRTNYAIRQAWRADGFAPDPGRPTLRERLRALLWRQP